MPLPEFFDDPVVMAALVLALAAAVHYQRGLTWTEYREYHRFKRRFFPLADRVWPRFVHDKGRTDDAEYVCTVDQSVKSVFKQLVAEGGSPHLVSSLKRRPTANAAAVEYSAAHVVWHHDDGRQTEAYLFRVSDRRTDVYAHTEPGVLRPRQHLRGEQIDGDRRGVVRAALGRAPTEQ